MYIIELNNEEFLQQMEFLQKMYTDVENDTCVFQSHLCTNCGDCL